MPEPVPTTTSNVIPAPKSVTKRLLIEILVGSALGMLVASLIGPRILSWWYEPPSKDAFSCASSVHNALGQFVWFQVIAAGLFGLSAVAISFLLRRRFAKS